MNRKKVATLAAIAMSGLVGVGLAVTGTAHAGVNGQQLRVCAPAPGGDFNRVKLEGTNQNGKSTEVTRDFKSDCHVIANYYWVGPVEVTMTHIANGFASDTRYICEVPKEFLPIEYDVIGCDPEGGGAP